MSRQRVMGSGERLMGESTAYITRCLQKVAAHRKFSDLALFDQVPGLTQFASLAPTVRRLANSICRGQIEDARRVRRAPIRLVASGLIPRSHLRLSKFLA